MKYVSRTWIPLFLYFITFAIEETKPSVSSERYTRTLNRQSVWIIPYFNEYLNRTGSQVITKQGQFAHKYQIFIVHKRCYKKVIVYGRELSYHMCLHNII